MLLPRFLLKDQPRPRYLNLIWLFLFWWLVSASLICLYAAYAEVNWRDPGVNLWLEVTKLLVTIDWEVWAILSGGALAMAVIHYLILRLIRGMDRQKIKWCEACLITCVAVVALITAGYSFHHLRLKIGWREAIWQHELTDELVLMVDRGEYRAAVIEMEIAMKEFRHAKKMLGDDAHYRQSGPSGISYLFTTCHLAWNHTDRHMPYGVGWFLQQPEDTIHRGNCYTAAKWQSLANEMAKSSDPVLICFGYWLLKDKTSFLECAYEEAESGNEACYGFALFAALQVDPDPLNGFRIALEYRGKVKMYHPSDFESVDHYMAVAGIRSLEAGQGFGAHKENFFIVLSRLSKSKSPAYLKKLWGKLAKHGYDRNGDKLESFIDVQ